MSDYSSIKLLMNTVEGMEHLVNNVPHDDDTMTFEGVDWFNFNDIVAENIYVSGNSWIGIGTSAEQLKVCRRDAKMYHFYRQEGTILESYDFLKIRWEGYTQYSSTSNEYKLIYEIFFISDNRIFLNIVQSPTNSSYLGTSALVCGTDTTSFTVGTTSPYYFTFTPTNYESGIGWSVENKIIVMDDPFIHKYLLSDNNNKIYTVENDALVELSETSFSKQLFLDYGIDNIPSSSLILSLRNPKLHYWQDSDYSLPTMMANAVQIPKAQSVLTYDVPLTHWSILGIENITIESDSNTLFAMSFDSGTTWWNYVNNTWVQLSEPLSGQTKDGIEAIGTNAWAQKITAGGHIMFRIILLDSGCYVDNITIYYIN